MLKGYLKSVVVILGVLVIVAPVSAEDFEILGTLTIKPDRCKELPDLAGTTWSGTIDVASGTGFHFDQHVAISIDLQQEHLFSGYITRFDYYLPPEVPPEAWIPVPFYGVFLGCYQIRVSSAHTVMFAELNETADVASGYVFSTDPFEGKPSEVLTPNMAVVEMTRDMEY